MNVLLALAALSGLTQAPEWSAFLNVRAEPSPYIADWESDPSLVTLVLSYSGSASVSFHLDGRIRRGAAPIVGGRSTAFEFVRPTQLILSTRDGIWDRNSVTYETALRDQIERTGRIPDGEYQFCVDVRQGLPESPGALLAQDCAPFSITAPQPPSLLAPAEGDSLRVPHPTFIWTPVVLGTSAQVSYHLRVAAILPGQSPLDALNNVPQYETDLTTTATSYPADALPLDDGTRYVWQVQALDGAGQPVGERQGKSEAWTFVWQRIPITVAQADSAPDAEPAVGQFRWAGLDVKVLSLTDSSRDNYTGVGRVKLIPGVFEPSFRFERLHLEADGSRVRYGPRHVISLPTGHGLIDYVLEWMPAPFFLNLYELVLVADSGRTHYAGVSGSAALFTAFGLVDSLENAPVANLATVTHCNGGVCRESIDIFNSSTEMFGQEVWERYSGLLSQSLFFKFDTLGIASEGPRGALRLRRDFVTDVYGLDGAELTFKKDSTVLVFDGREGRLEIQGSFQFPHDVGLHREKRDTTWTDSTKQTVESIDSLVALTFKRGRVDSSGELFIQTDGLPLVWVGQTGLGIRTSDAWIDLSGSVSRSARDPGWRGIYFDSVRVFLPRRWHTDDMPPDEESKPGNVQIAGYELSIDGAGLTGEVLGSKLDRLGPIGYGGLSGRLDSLHFVFNHGTLEEGYVRGRLRTPFLDGEVAYGVGWTPTGIDRMHASVGLGVRVGMPALGAEVLISRGEFFYDRPVVTFSFDGKLTIAHEGLGLKDANFVALGISSDGRITLGGGWIALDNASEARFNGFPVMVDSIGFGTGSGSNEVWLGVSGRFVLNENLPASAGAFRVFAQRDDAGKPWRFARFTVDKLDIRFENAAVNFRAQAGYLQNDPIYGNVFATAVRMSVQNQFAVDGTFIAGAAAAGFRYWYVDGRLTLPPPGIQLGPLPLAIWGFAGGAYSRMSATIDTMTLQAQYRPDSTNRFGLKAAVSIGTSANSGYPWNGDLWLEAAVGTSGGLQSLSLRGDYWMLTEVTKREHKVWGTVLIDLPVSQPVFHASGVTNINLPPAVRGVGTQELHFEPSRWYVNLGTPQRPDTLKLLPATLNLTTHSFMQFTPQSVAAGFSVELEKEKRKGPFRGKVKAGFDAAAELRYRPFQATGEGELWGDVKAEVKAGGSWFEIFHGEMRASMAFRFPDPMGVWGRIKLKYSVANGAYKGTYKMRYSWGDAPDDGESDSAQFVIVAATYPIANDTAAPVTGMTYYLGMNEGAPYGMDDGNYRLRLTGTPQLLRQVVVNSTRTDAKTKKPIIVPTLVWQSIGTPVRDWHDDRATLVLKAPGYATLQPATKYRAVTTFVLEKEGSSGWAAIQTVNSSIDFRTTGAAPILAQLVSETDPPGGATPLYFGGPNAGAVRVQFSNTHPDLTSGAIRAVLIANATDTVAGTWGTTSAGYTFGAIPRAFDPRLYAFRPAGGALAASTSYRFAIVSTDTSAREHYAVSFSTSRYATLLDHVNASTRTVTSTRGAGPASGAGSYLLGAQIVLAGPEPITWSDIDSIEVVGLANWTVTPRTRCQWAGGYAPMVIGSQQGIKKACGSPPTFENVLDIKFAAATDAGLPPGSTAALTVRINQRREGWRSFTFTLPSLATTVAGSAATIPTVAVPPAPSGGKGKQ